MIRLAYSTNAYTKWPLERAIADIRARGFDGVEVLADVPHAFPPVGDAAALKTALEGFPVSNLNANTYRDSFSPSLIDPDFSARKIRIEYTKQVLDLARALGAGNIAISTGPAPAKFKPRPLLIDSLEQILAYAERKPEVRVGIEYEPGHFVGDLRSLLGILNELDHPLLGANLDIGHARCVKDSIPAAVAELAGRTWNFHVEDIKARVHEHLIPGHGDIPWAKFRGALEKAKYDRFVTLEIYPYKDTPGEAGSESLAFLRKLFS